jgi:hypothetical protein
MPARTFETSLTLYHYEMENEVILDVDHDRILVYQPTSLLPLDFPAFGDFLYDPALDGLPVALRFVNVPSGEGTRGEGAELEFLWKSRRDPERVWSWNLWGNYSRRQVDRPVEFAELTIEDLQDDQGGSVTEVKKVLIRSSYLTDAANVGFLLRHKESFFGHVRARILGRPGDSIFDREARMALDVTLGFRLKRFEARLTGLNLTGADVLRSARDGSAPDLKPEWVLLVGTRWDF